MKKVLIDKIEKTDIFFGLYLTDNIDIGEYIRYSKRFLPDEELFTPAEIIALEKTKSSLIEHVGIDEKVYKDQIIEELDHVYFMAAQYIERNNI